MKRILNAVYGDDIISALKNIDEYDRVIAGKVKCKFCGEKITLDIISAIFPESGDVKYICSSPECITKMNYLSR